LEQKTFNAATYSMSHLAKDRIRSLTTIVTISLTIAFLLLTSSLLFGVISEIGTNEKQSILEGSIPGSVDMFEQFRIEGQLSEKARNSLVNYLLITSMIVLIVAFFIMYNTMAISVRERRKEIGILRSVGFSTGEVMKLFLVEGAMIGLISWISALFLGTPLIVNLSAYLIERGDRGIFFVQPVIPPQLVAISLVATMVLSLGSTYLATIGPVKSSPVAMMRNG
jgi:putative ABC transport system permease protein